MPRETNPGLRDIADRLSGKAGPDPSKQRLFHVPSRSAPAAPLFTQAERSELLLTVMDAKNRNPRPAHETLLPKLEALEVADATT